MPVLIDFLKTVVAFDESSGKLVLDNDIDGFKSAPGVGAKVLTAPCRPQE